MSFSEVSETNEIDVWEEKLQRERRIRRAFVFLAYSVFVWTCVVSWGEPDVHTRRLTLATAGFTTFSGVGVLFALTFIRWNEGSELVKMFLAVLGRTAAPVVCVFVCLLNCDESTKTSYATRALIAYFVTMPFHVWLTLPTSDAASVNVSCFNESDGSGIVDDKVDRDEVDNDKTDDDKTDDD